MEPQAETQEVPENPTPLFTGSQAEIFSHPTSDQILVKKYKPSNKKFGKNESKILDIFQGRGGMVQKIRDWEDEEGNFCIEMERLEMNLYEFIKRNNFKSLPERIVWAIAFQICAALLMMEENKVIHGDLKLENLCLTQRNGNRITVIDFGCSWIEGEEEQYSSLKNKMYKTPEQMLGIKTGHPIDMFSLGNICIELFTGYPIFQENSNEDRIGTLVQILDFPSLDFLEKSKISHKFFDKKGGLVHDKDWKGLIYEDGIGLLNKAMKGATDRFINFCLKCLAWDPDERITPHQALRDPWILSACPLPSLPTFLAKFEIGFDEIPWDVQVKLENSGFGP